MLCVAALHKHGEARIIIVTDTQYFINNLHQIFLQTSKIYRLLEMENADADANAKPAAAEEVKRKMELKDEVMETERQQRGIGSKTRLQSRSLHCNATR